MTAVCNVRHIIWKHANHSNQKLHVSRVCAMDSLVANAGTKISICQCLFSLGRTTGKLTWQCDHGWRDLGAFLQSQNEAAEQSVEAKESTSDEVSTESAHHHFFDKYGIVYLHYMEEGCKLVDAAYCKKVLKQFEWVHILKKRPQYTKGRWQGCQHYGFFRRSTEFRKWAVFLQIFIWSFEIFGFCNFLIFFKIF